MAIEHVGGIIIDGVSMAVDIIPTKGGSAVSDPKIFNISDADIVCVEVKAPSATHVGIPYIDVSVTGDDDGWFELHELTAAASGVAYIYVKTIVSGACYLRVRYIADGTPGIGELTVIATKKTRV